ncbi:MAG: hypothetical protein HC899_33725 [Leptolyngbyaceae cyanobacterium SM1_4_3]|nr:hypothetical protein [Leptolyngbyaceae cyanobacterium SM1_4_3]NJN91827.1 hypothetical protein [Leptolyngbyaceae cyanobacterium SL_5_14]
MKNPPNLDFEHLREQIEKIYHTAITSFFSACNEIMQLGSQGIFMPIINHLLLDGSLRQYVEGS